jgi:hypothetical protein
MGLIGFTGLIVGIIGFNGLMGYIPYGWKNGFENAYGAYGAYGNKEGEFVCKTLIQKMKINK